jgi:hypothetical protein
MQHRATDAFAGALAILTACRPTAESTPSPHVVCDDPSPGFGRILQGETFTHAFRLRNLGTGWLRIDRVDPSYSCLAQEVPALVAPGESADVRVRCDAGDRQNRMVDRLVLHSNDPAVPELALGIEADVEPLLALSSRTVDLEPPFGGRDSREVNLVGLWANAARLAVETVEPEGPEVQVVPAPDGGGESVRVTVRGDRVGRSAGQVVLTTGLIKPATLTLLYSWRVPGNVIVDPTNPVSDLRAPGPTGAVVRVAEPRKDVPLFALGAPD